MAASLQNFRRALRSLVAALAPPLGAFTVQALLWPVLSPLAWFLFYPAVFFSSWLGGVASGIGATLLSAALVTWYFIPPRGALAVETRYFLSAGVFVATGILFSAFHQRLRRARRVARVFAALIENSSDFIGIADADGKPIYVNPAGRRLVGLAADHPIERTAILEYYPPAERPFVSAVILQSMAERGLWQGETFFRHWQTGRAIPVSDTHFLIHDPANGRLLGMGTITRDISEAQKNAREAALANERLRESEARFRFTLDEAPIGMALVALDGRFVRVNRALSELVGYGAGELTGASLEAITHPDDLGVDLALAGQLARGEIPRYQIDKRYLRKDGSIVDAVFNAAILRDQGGAPRYYIVQIEDVTERKRADDALRRSESQFRGLIEQLPDGVLINQSGRLAYANRAMAALLGYDDAAALAGRPVMDLVHPDDRAAVTERIRSILKTGIANQPKELRMARRDGSFCAVETVALRVRFADRTGIVVIVRDLTERKRAEEALRVSEAKFSGIVSISADAIISIDDRQRITIFNDGAERIFGYSKAEALGAPLDRLIPDHQRQVERFAARAMGARLATISGLRKSGEEFPAEAAISKLRVGDKTLLTVALRDITDRKRTEREQELLTEASAALAASLDYEATLATVARLAVRDFADWCAVEILQEHENLRRLKVACADPSQAELCALFETLAIDRTQPCVVRSVLETRRPLVVARLTEQDLVAFSQTTEHLRALKSVGANSLMVLPLLVRRELLGLLVFVSSTPSRTYGPRDLRLAEALAERAAAAIENARLYRAAVHATQLRDHVLGVVAHDLRNPLGTILMQTSALEQRGTDPARRSRNAVEIIRRAVSRMNRLIQDLLDVGRMEAGQLRIERAPLGAAALIAEAVETQRPIAASSALEVRLELGRDLPEVLGDRDRLLQVFENLIGNALKFTPAGGRVTIGARARGHEVVFSVADTGRGIAPEALPRVFDRFWQATRAGRAGAGLGLSIAKGIVEAHGGRIWVESAPGRGTTFFFSIPAAAPAEERPAVVH